jgi:hypothetical protein
MGKKSIESIQSWDIQKECLTQNHSQNTNLNDQYIYKINFWYFFYISYSHFLIKLVVIFCDFMIKMYLNVVKNDVSLHHFIEKESIGLIIFVDITPYFNHK